MARLVQNGTPLADEILIQPQPRMHRAVAVANALKRWIAKDPKQCLELLFDNDIILVGTVTTEAGVKRISVRGRKYFLVSWRTRDGRELPERCCYTAQSGSREPYWVLDPLAKGDTRYVISTDRGKTGDWVDLINRLARAPQSAIHGIVIELDDEDRRN